ncbi:MAG TPA: FAD:protein FMN transferase [Candidatus Eisenbacteria bacterium]|nr:FAD:protein FMN transferase [Candidatus Eisenbacteria bacterium]
MTKPLPHDAVLEPAGTRTLDRRRFLLQLGILAGVGALPVVAGRSRERGATRLEIARPALGTWVRVVVEEDDGARGTRAVEAAFAAIRTVDLQMSVHREDSQVTRINAAAGQGSVHVDAAVQDVVERACAGARATSGLYDPTILPLMKLYGFYGTGRDRYPTDREISAALERTGHRHVVIDRAAGTIGIARSGVAIDLGSIGKGYALDRAIDAIREHGVRSALVDVGGNVYGLGSPSGHPEGWTVGVLHPVTGRVDRTFTLRDRAVATSGNAEQSRVLGGRRVGHLLDARRGRPADGPLSVSVEAENGTDSDRLSTTAFLLGPGRFTGFPGALRTHFIG